MMAVTRVYDLVDKMDAKMVVVSVGLMGDSLAGLLGDIEAVKMADK